MKRIVLAALIASFAAGSAMAQSCTSKAVGKDGKPLAGAAKTSFMKKCCEDSAVGKDGKPLSGAAKTSSVTKCVKGVATQSPPPCRGRVRVGVETRRESNPQISPPSHLPLRHAFPMRGSETRSRILFHGVSAFTPADPWATSAFSSDTGTIHKARQAEKGWGKK